MNYSICTIKTIKATESDQLGALSFFESERSIPFSIQRVYYIFDVAEGMHRGGHAHKSLWQLLVCPYGSIRIDLDDGKEKASVLLDRPEIGLIVSPGLWRDMIWKEERSVLLVAASEYYDASDYIRNYDEFLSYAKGFGYER